MDRLKRKKYEKLIEPMQAELVVMARWIATTGQRMVVLFEGRDTAGKGGAIQAVADKINPRQCRVVALGKPSEVEAGQWYFRFRAIAREKQGREQFALDCVAHRPFSRT